MDAAEVVYACWVRALGFSEECALVCRRRNGIPDDRFPSGEDVDRFAESLPGLTLEAMSHLPLPTYFRIAPERGVMGLPCRYTSYDLVHECHHHIRGDGLAAYLKSIAGDDPRLLSLAKVCKWQEEAQARAFVTAYYLPAPMVLSHRDYDLAEMARLPVQVVNNRRWAILRKIRKAGISLADGITNTTGGV